MTANRLSTTFGQCLTQYLCSYWTNPTQEKTMSASLVICLADSRSSTSPFTMSTFGRWRDASRALVFGPDLDTATISMRSVLSYEFERVADARTSEWLRPQWGHYFFVGVKTQFLRSAFLLQKPTHGSSYDALLRKSCSHLLSVVERP